MGQKPVGARASLLVNVINSTTNPDACTTTVMATRIKATRSVESIVNGYLLRSAKAVAFITGVGIPRTSMFCLIGRAGEDGCFGFVARSGHSTLLEPR
jgi:hypothetical protein